jgi:hypothetical protein
MSGQSRTSRFRDLFESALQDYEKTTNISLAKHPLAEQLQNHSSVESITTFFQDHARKFGDFPGSDRFMRSIKNIISILCTLSASAALGDSVHLVMSQGSDGLDPRLIFILSSFPPAKAIRTGLAILLDVCVLSKFPCVMISFLYASASGRQGGECQL